MRKAVFGLLVVSLFLSLPAFAGRVALILDVGGRGDLSFNDMGFKGTEEAMAEFGWEMTVIQSATAADYLPNIRNAARTRAFDLILCVGFLLADALNQVAPEFPDQKFAIIDAVVDQPNVLSIVFEEQEGSALVGALAGMLAAHYGYPYVGVVLGIEIPVLYHFEGGYRFGIDWGLKKYAQVTGEEPNVGLLWVYTGTFSDIAKGKAAAEAQLEQGAVAVYNVAGPLGIGILEAVTEKLEELGREAGPPFMIGVDANQDWMGDGNKVIASMMKRVDVGCYTAIKMVHEGTFEGGILRMGLANRGVGISRFLDLLEFIDFGVAAGAIGAERRPEIAANWAAVRASLPTWIWKAVDELEKKILSGEIVVPKPATREEMLQVRELYPLVRE
ncbi:TPA: BMP family ABC transporter substrate-binding protein [Candidatus Bipolaricaulota bacterium]|nr:BMP family ABC transporter substrate-binding protein [Candidatus Bipolaricaulota bacterium]